MPIALTVTAIISGIIGSLTSYLYTRYKYNNVKQMNFYPQSMKVIQYNRTSHLLSFLNYDINNIKNEFSMATSCEGYNVFKSIKYNTVVICKSDIIIRIKPHKFIVMPIEEYNKHKLELEQIQNGII